MRQVRINYKQKAVVVNRGRIKSLLNEGKHWIGFRDEVFLFDWDEEVRIPGIKDQLDSVPFLAKELLCLDVPFGSKAVCFNYDIPTRILASGKYYFWKANHVFSFLILPTSSQDMISNVNLSLLNHPLLEALIRKVQIEPHEQALLYVNGEYKQLLMPGVHYFFQNAHQILLSRVDMRSRFLEVAGQELLTRDKAPLRLNVQVLFRVNNPVRVVLEHKEYERELYLLVQLALREYVSGMSLDELLDKRSQSASHLNDLLQIQLREMGIELQSCGLRDIILPGEMREMMNVVLLAEKKAQAQLIQRREETAATRNLLNTARLMEENSMLFRLKEMEYIERIADRIDSISLNGGSQLTAQLKELFGHQ